MANNYSEKYGSGWIKLYRALMEKGWYKKPDHIRLWIHILLKASHSGNQFYFNGKNIYLEPGQFITGRKKLAIEIGISESKVERILNFFEKSEQQIAQQKTNKNRVITVLNWTHHQQIEQQNEQQVNNKRTTSEQQVNTIKNVKNDNNDKKEKKEWFDDLIPDALRGNGFIDTWKEWVDFRRAKKKPISERAAAAQLKKLAAHPNPEAVLEYSIMNDYQGLFPEKIKGVRNETRKSPQQLANRAEQIYNSIANETGNRSD